jgi:hypothetical protein
MRSRPPPAPHRLCSARLERRGEERRGEERRGSCVEGVEAGGADQGSRAPAEKGSGRLAGGERVWRRAGGMDGPRASLARRTEERARGWRWVGEEIKIRVGPSWRGMKERNKGRWMGEKWG